MSTAIVTREDCFNALLGLQYCCQIPEANPSNLMYTLELAQAACLEVGTDDAETALHRLAEKMEEVGCGMR